MTKTTKNRISLGLLTILLIIISLVPVYAFYGGDNPYCDSDLCTYLGTNCCPAGETCKSGECVFSCVPNCQGKQCGSDGCGGSCGSCPASTPFCDPGGNCYECNTEDDCGSSINDVCILRTCVCYGVGPGRCPACTPNCAGKQCGSDGCGGSCGSCGTQGTCNNNGICEYANPCDTNPCPNGWTCTPLGGSCSDPGVNCPYTSRTCSCTPNCAGKQCGSDGCGGSCGSCPASTPFCDPGGNCYECNTEDDCGSSINDACILRTCVCYGIGPGRCPTSSTRSRSISSSASKSSSRRSRSINSITTASSTVTFIPSYETLSSSYTSASGRSSSNTARSTASTRVTNINSNSNTRSQPATSSSAMVTRIVTRINTRR